MDARRRSELKRCCEPESNHVISATFAVYRGKKGQRVVLRIERNVQFARKLCGIKRAAGNIPFADLQRWNLPLPMIRSNDDGFSGRIFFDVHFVVGDPALLQKVFRTAAVSAPVRGVHGDWFH